MPAERRASPFGHASRQLVCGAEACSENEQLFGVVSGFQPGASAVNPGKAADRGDDGSCHAGRLARLDRDLARRVSVFVPVCTRGAHFRCLKKTKVKWAKG
jgi:hypothetical protein